MAPVPSGHAAGLYVHVPFCAHICPYCDFNTYAGQEALIPRYVEAVCRDIASQAASLTGRRLATIYLGGGTPSLLSAEQIGAILGEVRMAYDLDPGAEVTLEANPNSVDQAYFSGLLEAGVNRLSLGVQTTQHRGLRVLGRQHEAVDAEQAFAAARSAGFDNISLDLIFGWPDQTVDAWEADLAAVSGWSDRGPDHLSLYSLIVEPGTPMAEAVTRRILTPLDDDTTADLYESAIATLAAAGWVHYEVSNWARAVPGEFGTAAGRSTDLPAFASRHNVLYWRNGDYLAVGAGAHGHLAGRRMMNHLLPRTYIEAIEAGRLPISNEEHPDQRAQMGETMMVGLRLLGEGVEDAAFAARHGMSLNDSFGDVIGELSRIALIERHPERIRLTPRGLMLANDVCARFL